MAQNSYSRSTDWDTCVLWAGIFLAFPCMGYSLSQATWRSQTKLMYLYYRGMYFQLFLRCLLTPCFPQLECLYQNSTQLWSGQELVKSFLLEESSSFLEPISDLSRILPSIISYDSHTHFSSSTLKLPVISQTLISTELGCKFLEVR